MFCMNCEHELERRFASIPAEVKGEPVVVEGMMVFLCPSCDYRTVRSEDMPEFMRRAADAYRREHGLLTSEEIRSRRSALQMTQEDFAGHLSVGIASVKRWELGQVQEKAMDSLIRLRTSWVDAEANFREIEQLQNSTQKTERWTSGEAPSASDSSLQQFAYAA